MPTVAYRVTPADPRAHYFEVACELTAPDAAGQLFRLPSWIRGSYLVRDFAKHVVGLRASCGGETLAVERLDKRSFRCAPASGPLRLEYRVYAFDESVRKAYLDTRRGFFNGTSLFYCPAGFESADFRITLERPADPACSGWKAATAMPPAQVDADGFGTYLARGYEELMDHPFELGRLEPLAFDVDGIPHQIVLSGRYELDRARLTADLARICHAGRELFGQEPALDRYLFLTNVVAAGYGGLEHRASCALICSRQDLPRAGDATLSREYRAFLGLCSHEYFHLWNVKRITAQSFLASDLATESYTRDLWHYEGVTSYYDDLLLLRAGVIDAPAYLDLLAQTASRLQRSPGRQLHTLADASLEAWIKYYQPDENTPNATVNYYVKGALAALCLDLTLRLRSAVTLDDVMRQLWQRHGREGVGVPEGGLEAVALELSGLDLQPLLDRMLRGTEELPLVELLREFGVGAELRPAAGEMDGGGRTAGRPPPAYVGVALRPGEATVLYALAGTPAMQAGLSGGDVLVALDGLRLMPAGLNARLSCLQPGRSYTLHFFRGDELMSTTLTPAVPPADTWTFTLAEATPAVLERRRAWLGC